MPQAIGPLHTVMLPLLETPWKCALGSGVVLKSPHRLKDISICIGKMVSSGNDYYEEQIFKSICYI